jgi:putative FmdB family regulatory protein
VPIYEFICEKCNTVYKFFSRTVNTEKIPDCPNCKDIRLKRRMSLFAAISGGKEEDGGAGDMPHIDEEKMEKAMSMLAGEAGSINEDDPRQAANLMRNFSDATGLKMGAGMEEALSRLERGEDPDRIEDEMGDIFESEEPFTFDGKGKRSRKIPGPKVDETLYEF